MMGEPKFRPVTRETAAQSVASQIMEQIRLGALRPGDRLPTERELMQAMDVGRSSVREGLQMLATLNLVEATRGSGTFVRQPATDEIFRPDLFGVLMSNSAALELVEARQLVEPSGVRLACTRATVADLDRIEQLLDEHEKALARGDAVNEYAARFHIQLARASHNQIIARFMESILELLLARGRKLDRIPDYAHDEVKEHRDILNLVRAGDPDAAEAAISAHIVRSAETYDRAEEPRGDGNAAAIASAV